MESSTTPNDPHEAPQQLLSSRDTLDGAERSTDTTPRVPPIIQLPHEEQDVNSDAGRIDCAISIHISSTDSDTGISVGNYSAITNADEARLAILRISQQFHVPITLGRQHVVFRLPGQPPPLLNGPFTLESVGPDIRKIIFAFLLKNKDLGKLASATVDAMKGITRYGLEPTILRTCKAFHDEGIRVLYEGQPYYIFCSKANNNYSISCPLIRYTRYDGDLRYTPLRSISAVKRVKQWVVVLDGRALRNQGAPPFTEVCRALCDTLLNKLTICVVPLYWDGENTWESGVAATELEHNNHKDIRTILAPLKMLRNLNSCDIEIRDAVSEEFFLPYVNANSKSRSLVGSLPRQNTYIPDILRLIKGSTPVELGFKMFDLLLSYSQAFERQPTLKAQMAPLGLLNTYFSSSYHHKGYRWPHFSGREDFENPFVNHPVERGLQSAEEFVWDAKDIKKFKKERRKILDYLEPQYQRISRSSLNLEQFIKLTKGRGGFFEGNFPDDLRVITHVVLGLRPFHECRLPCHCDNDGMHIDMFTAVHLVREYAKSFERDMPIYVRADIMEQQRHFDDLFIDLPRDQMFSRLDRRLELKQFEGVHVLLRKIIDCIDDQLIEIREARKNLFDADVYLDQRGVDLPVRDLLCVEHVNWDVEEPGYTEIGPYEPPPESEFEVSSDDNDGSDDGDQDAEAGEAATGNTNDQASQDATSDPSNDVSTSEESKSKKPRSWKQAAKAQHELTKCCNFMPQFLLCSKGKGRKIRNHEEMDMYEDSESYDGKESEDSESDDLASDDLESEDPELENSDSEDSESE